MAIEASHPDLTLFLPSFDLYILFSSPPELMICMFTIVVFVLSITEKHTLPIKTCQQSPPLALMEILKGYTILLRPPTITSRPHLFSPFDINVKENMLPLRCYSTFHRYQIFDQHIILLTGWTLLGERRDDTQLLTEIFKWCLS
jgi:hypothetical protein